MILRIVHFYVFKLTSVTYEVCGNLNTVIAKHQTCSHAKEQNLLLIKSLIQMCRYLEISSY